jgi:hypothetical protein
MRPAPGEVLHFSEDPTITEFVPHVARTAVQPVPYVWALDADRVPGYWFPRHCPRAMAWRVSRSGEDDVERILGPGGGDRVHAIEYSWLDRVLTVRLFAYRLPAERFARHRAGRRQPDSAGVSAAEGSDGRPGTPRDSLWRSTWPPRAIPPRLSAPPSPGRGRRGRRGWAITADAASFTADAVCMHGWELPLSARTIGAGDGRGHVPAHADPPAALGPDRRRGSRAAHARARTSVGAPG